MSKQFPRTTVAGVSMPRMIIGSNWFFGSSHKSMALDREIMDKFSTVESFQSVFKKFLDHGVDAFMACLSDNELFYNAVQEAEQRTGKKIIIIDTPVLNVDDADEARREAEAKIKECARTGATFCLPLHSCSEQLVDKNKGTMDRLPDYTKMIRDNGMIPGLSAHMAEIPLYCDENDYDVQTYIQIYNCLGFLMQVEVETVAKIIHNAKKPVMVIKPMAAGRTTPYIGLNFVYNTLRECDMVTVGVNSTREAEEVIEIGLAAIERRLPEIEGRNSTSRQKVLKW